MKILVITGSPHKRGTSATLAERFIEGAVKAGHEVARFDAALESVAPCLGCDYCRTVSDRCVHKDSMDKLNPDLLRAEMVVFVTPLYYFGMSAQLKAVIDRFYASNAALRESPKRSMLIAAAHDQNDWTMGALEAHYRTLLRYLHWKDAGCLLATGCRTREDVEATDYPERAYQMGRGIA